MDTQYSLLSDASPNPRNVIGYFKSNVEPKKDDVLYMEEDDLYFIVIAKLIVMTPDDATRETKTFLIVKKTTF